MPVTGANETAVYHYQGPSMNPLLWPGDGVFVDDTPYQSLCRGDVICFRDADESKFIIHRIVKVTPAGLVTRGDNNKKPDPFLVTPALAPQRVTHVRRGRRTIRIQGGETGMLVFRKNRIYSFFMRRLIHPLILASDRFLLPLLKGVNLLSAKKLSVREFKKGSETKKMLFYKQRKIGYQNSDGSWHVRFPWRLIVDPEKIH